MFALQSVSLLVRPEVLTTLGIHDTSLGSLSHADVL